VQYVINRYDQDHRISYPKGSLEDTEINNWLLSGMSPSRVARNYHEASQEAPQKIPYSIEHFGNRTFGLFSILDQHLNKTRTDYIAGTK
jgi:glutathione S-transferase